MDLEFEWDADKAAANVATHGVTFEEASTLFGDPLSYSGPDPRHSQGEARFAILGRSARGTNVVVLDPDVAAVYPTAEAVNSALRALAEVARRQAGRAAA